MKLPCGRHEPLLRSEGVAGSSRAAAGRPAARRTLRGAAAALLALAALLGALLQASAALAQERVPSDWALKPKAIGAGKQFRLVFATSNQPLASSSDIAAYDRAVQNRVRGFGHMAIQGYASGFKVLGCTSTVDARTHTETRATDTGVPIYWVGRTKVADDYEDLYDGSWDSNGASNEAGERFGGTDAEVRTGCVADGTARSGGYLGALTVAVTNARQVKANGLYEGDLIVEGSRTRLFGLSPVFQVNTVPASSDGKVTATEDTSYPFTVADFVFSDGDQGDTLASVTVVTLPVAGTGSLTLSGAAVSADDVVTAADIVAGNLEFTPAANANGAGHASFTFKVSDRTEDSASSYTMTIDVTAVNDVTTGMPMIPGSPIPQERVPSDWDLKPGAIDAGGQFRLVFVTSNQPPTSSSDIAAYDMVVQNRVRGSGHMAIQEYANGFRVLGCTSTVDARTHTGTTGTGVPIYWVGHSKVADDYSDLYDGSWTSNGARKEAGHRFLRMNVQVRTGCSDDGTAEPGASLGLVGATVVAVTDAREGRTHGLYKEDVDFDNVPTHLFGLSPVFQVNNLPTASPSEVEATEGTDYIFAASDFVFSDDDSDALASVILTSLPATGKGELKFDGSVLTSADLDKTVTVADLGNGLLVYDPPATGSGSGFASFDFKVNDGTEESAAATLTIDVVAAVTVTSIARQDPSSSPTHEDRLIWRVTFSESVSNVDAADFEVSGTTATVAVTGSGTTYDVMASGGNLAGLDATVTLSFATGQDIEDAAANDLTATTPTGTNENDYVVDNTAPTVAITVPSTTRAAFTATFTFSEAVTGFVLSDIALVNATASNFVSANAPVYTALITPTEEGTVTVNVAASVAEDLAGNDNTAATEVSSTYDTTDTTAPGVTSIEHQKPSSSPTNEDSLTWRVTFDEAVSNVDAADFEVTGTTATVTVTGSGTTYDVTASGGNLAGLDATVTLSFAGGQDIEDAAANDLTNTAPMGTDEDSYVVDNTAPTVTIGGVPTTSSAVFTATFTFSEAVTGFDVNDIALGNATASNFTVTNAAVYTARITPTADGTVTVNVAAAAAEDEAGNDNTAAKQASSIYTADTTAPTVTSIVRQDPSNTPTHEDHLTWQVTFSEAVSNVDAADFSMTGTTATVTVTGSGTTYDVTASGGNLAGLDGKVVTLSFVGGQDIEDAAGNALTATTPTGTNENGYVLDNTAPTVRIRGVPTTSSAAFTATFTFSEFVTGFVVGDITLGNATSSNFVSANAPVYTARITPTEDGEVTVDVAAGVATDIAGNANTMATQASSIYKSNTAPTGADKTVSTPEDTAYTFLTGDFTFLDGDTGDTLASVTVLTIPAAAGSLTLSNAAVSVNDVVAAADIAAGNLKFIPAANANGAGHASFTFKVSDGLTDSASTYTMTIDVTAVNDVATGMPTITGRARVGETLTASTTGIADVDGLPSSGFTWQWIRVAADATETNIGTGASYTLLAADQGATIVVTVSFTDDDGTAEGPLRSAATVAVGTSRGICGRTAAVRTAILREIPGVSNCADVTDAHLAAITGTLNLSGKRITALAAWDFDGLTALTVLGLSRNLLTTLPTGVFDELTALTTLVLGNNPGAPFSPTADALPDAGTVSRAGGTVTLDGSGSSGGPWGTNVTYSWALTAPASGVTVTFDDAASATPVVTIPALTAGTELTFTLTVTGRGSGGGNGIAPATDTATVTVTAAPNTPATGQPAIEGTAQVGEVLTATIGTIADATDGLPTGTFPTGYTFAWVRVDAANTETAIGTSSSYTPVAADVGATIRVTVSFTDAAGNSETLTSDATAAVMARDTTAPTVTSITRQSPTSSPTREDSLTWQVTFSEDVTNVDAADFTVTGTSATPAVTGSGTTYSVTVSGGNLADLDATVTLAFDSNQNIQDTEGNALATTTPAGTNENDYVVDNTAPTVAITGVPGTSAAPFTATVTFSEAVTGFVLGDIRLGNATASNFTDTNAPVYTALITPTTDGAVTVNVAAGVAEDLAGNANTVALQATSTYTAVGTVTESTDCPDTPLTTCTFVVGSTVTGTLTANDQDDWKVMLAEGKTYRFEIAFTPPLSTGQAFNAELNDLTRNFVAYGEPGFDVSIPTGKGGTHLLSLYPTGDSYAGSYTITVTEVADTIVPRVASFLRHEPESSPTHADSLTWRVTFTEAVMNVTAADFMVTGTTATLAVTGSGTTYDVTASGGNLADLDATVTLGFASGQDIEDMVGNAFVAPTGPSPATYVVDNTAPTVAITGVPGTSAAPFTATVTFSEAVTGFVLGDIGLGNATASNFTDTNAPVYTALITPTTDGAVTVNVAAGVAEDLAGNANTVALQASSIYTAPDTTAPTVTSITRQSPDELPDP